MSTKTTAHLSREHRQATHLLGAFRRYLRHIEEDNVPDSREPSGLIDFLEESLFQRHEEKEEGLLLPELARMGLSWSDGALAEVRHEHRQGRYLLRSLKHAMRQGVAWSKEDRAHFLANAHEWVVFLRDHMLREEQVLFPFVDSRLSDDSDEILARQFEQIDREYGAMADFHDMQKAGEAFLAKYGTQTQES
jgi:hemerythrin-like domain-containing protein